MQRILNRRAFVRIRRRLTNRPAVWSGPPGRSAFWNHISEEHARDLSSFGPERAKRHQALAYFTWQWDPLKVLADPQLRFLIRHRPLRELLAAMRGPIDGDWGDVQWSRMKRRTYVAAVRLLWEFAREHGDPRVLALREPELGAPLPVWWRGRLISQDLANTALEVATMRPALDRPRSFLEIGAGYGRTAYALTNLYPEAHYTIVDIEPALSIARWYLTQLVDPGRLTFLAPEDIGQIPDGSIDIAVTISTFPELTAATVRFYLDQLDRLTSGGHVYLKQWTSWRNGDDLVRMTMEDYPYPSRWRQLHWAPAPVQTRFTEGLWAVPA